MIIALNAKVFSLSNGCSFLSDEAPYYWITEIRLHIFVLTNTLVGASREGLEK